MTHHPPDPEGRQAKDTHMTEETRTLDTRIEFTARALYALLEERERLTAMAPYRFYVYNATGTLRVEVAAGAGGVMGFAVADASFAARLDAALAVKDAGEAVERCWALVRELRGEST